jgi:protein involved in polysaccharide export with SLBB domain
MHINSKNIIKFFLFVFVISFSTNALASYSYDENVFAEISEDELKPFGENLFVGQFSVDQNIGVNPNYVIQRGDEVSVSIWGDIEYTNSHIVDNQGNILIPKVGPVAVEGVKNSNLSAVVNKQVREVFPSGVEVYTNLLGTKPVSVFVTGAVNKPGRYSGVSTDSLLHYLDKAQGVDYKKGSFRNIKLIRDNEVIEVFDVYNFLLNGEIPQAQLENNDIILVAAKGLNIAVEGDVKNRNIFEFRKNYALGQEVIDLAIPNVGVTHVSISGFRNNQSFSKYLTLKQFRSFDLYDGDSVRFHTAIKPQTIKIYVDGEYLNPGVIVAPQGSTLVEILSQIEVDPKLANYESVRIERKSVARQQKIALENSLRRLEESVFVAKTYSAEEQEQKTEEARLISAFIENARKVQPKGTVVVSDKNGIEDIKLQNEDRIVIPTKTNIVLVTGEVTVPSAVIYNPEYDIEDYIEKAGGFSIRADSDKMIVLKANGATVPAYNTRIEPGDQIMILPEIKVDRISIARNVADLLYKVILSVAIPINLFDD